LTSFPLRGKEKGESGFFPPLKGRRKRRGEEKRGWGMALHPLFSFGELKCLIYEEKGGRKRKMSILLVCLRKKKG